MIVETILSTLDPAGRPNFAPMGVTWGEEEVIVRPFRATDTCRNLLATGFGVVNVTDDVQAFVESALGDVDLPHFPASVVPGVVFGGVCYWRELELVSSGGTPERAEMRCRVVGRGWRRDFLGFSRARGAVIEAAILATRLNLVDHAGLPAVFAQHESIVRKTGDAAERLALQRLWDYLREWHDEAAH